MSAKIREQYHNYILAVVSVGEIRTAKEIQNMLFDYNPNAEKGRPKRAFHHKNMPNPTAIGSILRVSHHFEMIQIGTGNRNIWRRTQ
jgi:hypothetical protein